MQMKGQNEVKRTAEAGSVVVEATIVVPIFLLAIFFIINLTNILILHNRVQFAINQSAQELASYAYVYSMANDAVEAFYSDGKPYTSKVEETMNNIKTFLEKVQDKDYSGSKESGESAFSSLKDLLSDPKMAAVGTAWIAAEKGIEYAESSVVDSIISKLTEKYLENGSQDADKFLQSYGVKDGYGSLDFSGSRLLREEAGGQDNVEMIDVVVQYDIDMLPFHPVFADPKIHVVQRVTIPAWMDGDGGNSGGNKIKKQWR